MSLVDIGILCVAEIVGDFGFQQFANKGGMGSFVTGLGGYIATIYLLIIALQGSSILLVNAARNGVSSILESLAAIIILGDRFDDWEQWLGLALIISGLFFLKMPVTRQKDFKFPRFFGQKTEGFLP